MESDSVMHQEDTPAADSPVQNKKTSFVTIAGMITSLAWIVLYGYVIRKLTRPEIRAEFLS